MNIILYIIGAAVGIFSYYMLSPLFNAADVRAMSDIDFMQQVFICLIGIAVTILCFIVAKRGSNKAP